METKKTAVEWFINETYHLGGTMIFNNGQRVFYLAIEQYEELLKQAKQMEKEQIKTAFEFGEDNIDSLGYYVDNNGSENYYNETYGKDNENNN